MVKAGKHPWPGMTLPVVVDRQNPERIDIQWEELKTIDERMAEGGPSPAAGGQPQVIDLRGTELAKLRDTGVLSQAEFEAEKARILAG